MMEINVGIANETWGGFFFFKRSLLISHFQKQTTTLHVSYDLNLVDTHTQQNTPDMEPLSVISSGRQNH